MMTTTSFLDVSWTALERACWQGSLVVLRVWSLCRWLPAVPARFQAWFWRLAALKFLIVLRWPLPLPLRVLPRPVERMGAVQNPRRPRRRSDEQYTLCLESLLQHHTDVLITHDGPDDPVGGHRGSPVIREAVERLRPSLVVRGHAYWKEPLVQLAGGVQVLNVDARVVVLQE